VGRDHNVLVLTTATREIRVSPDSRTANDDRRDLLCRHLAEVYDTGHVPDENGESRSILPSGMPRESGARLRDLLVAEGATTTIEVGLALGLSTLHICDALLEHDASGRHTAIDPLERSHYGNAGLLSLERAGVRDLVEHVDLSSDLALPTLLRDRRGEFDVALVDGAHWFDYAFLDAFLCMQLVRPGGVVVLDDTWMPGPRLAARYLVTNLGCTEIPDVLPQGRTAGRRGLLQPHWPHMTALRTPAADAPGRHRDAFVPFGDPPVSVGERLAGVMRVIRRRLGSGAG
jgi:predicted O-methyltransferase YrrM